jgi:hypothetical protein
MPNPDDGSGTVRSRGGYSEDQYDIFPLLKFLATVGCLLILLYALRFWTSGDVLRILGVGILVAAASLTLGFLIAFIFCIPHTRSDKDCGPSANQDASTSDPNAPPPVSDAPSRNLVELSDWLTKIIISLGLVELKSIITGLGSFSYYVGTSLSPETCQPGMACNGFTLSGQVAALAIMFFYFALGFLWGSLWTYLYFQRDLGKLVQRLQQYKNNTDFIWNAEADMKEGKLDEAMEEIDQAIKNNPKDGRAVLTKARILKRKAEQPDPQNPDRTLLNQALEVVNLAIALLPGKAEPIYNKACYQALLGIDKSEVFANLRSAFKLNPGLMRTAAGDPDRPDSGDPDLARFRQDADFRQLVGLHPLRVA